MTTSLKRRLLSSGAWAFGGRVVAAITALASNALLARLLSPQDLGTYFLAYSIVGLGWLIGSLGLNHAVVRFVAESIGLNRLGRARRAILMVLVLGIIGASGTGFVYLLLGGFLGEHLFHAPALAAITGLMAGWITVVTLQGLLAEIFRGMHDVRLATIFGNFNGVLTGVLLVISLALLWLFRGQASLITLVLLAATSSCTSVLLAGWILRRKMRSFPPNGVEDRIGYGEVLQVAWPLLTTNLILFALAQADLWLVGAFRSPEEVAIYGAAARTVLLVAMPLVIIDAIVPAIIAEMYAQGKKQELERTLRTIATLAGVPAFLMLIGFILFGGQILSLVFGSYYMEGATVLAVLSMGQLAQVCTGSCAYTLTMTGHQATHLVITVFSGTVTVLAGLWGVVHYGVLGVASAVCAGFVIQNVSLLLAARYRTGVWTHVGTAEFSSLIRAIRTFKISVDRNRRKG